MRYHSGTLRLSPSLYTSQMTHDHKHNTKRVITLEMSCPWVNKREKTSEEKTVKYTPAQPEYTGVYRHNQSIIPSTDVTQLTLTLKMTTAQVNNNSPIQDYVHPDDQTQCFSIY